MVLFKKFLDIKLIRKLPGANFLLLLLFCIHLFFAWPGLISSDSDAQYIQAVNGVYDDHHPPLMAFVWRQLDKVYQGSGLMLLINLLMLYISTFFLIRAVDDQKVKYLLVLTPIIPNVLLYSVYIWKDVAFAFTFLQINCYLAFNTIKKQKISYFALLLLLLILLYGAAVKYQAQYLAIFPLFWLVYAVNNYKLNYQFILKYLVVSVVFYYSLFTINNILVPYQQKSNSWQFVKMYDIAAISIDIDKPLLPDFIKIPGYTEEEMRLRFTHRAIDPLIFEELELNKKPILRKTNSEKEQEELLAIWKGAVLSHSFYYLKHRFINIHYNIFIRVNFDKIKAFLKEYYSVDSYQYKVAHAILGLLGYILLAHFLPVILAFIYLGLSIYCFYNSRHMEIKKYALILFFFNIIAVGMFCLLLFFSMAGTPRYTYICVCMVHASHYFAYICYKALNWKKVELNLSASK